MIYEFHTVVNCFCQSRRRIEAQSNADNIAKYELKLFIRRKNYKK